MSTVLTVLHVIVCVFLIAVVLLQRGKGAQMGAVFGGGASSTVFGSRGAGNFLTKLTTGAAVVFMATSLSLSYVFTAEEGERLFQDGEIEGAAPPVTPESLFEEVETVPAAPPATSGSEPEAAVPSTSPDASAGSGVPQAAMNQANAALDQALEAAEQAAAEAADSAATTIQGDAASELAAPPTAEPGAPEPPAAPTP